MAKQLPAMPEESTTGFTVPYRESTRRSRLALSSQLGQSESNYSSISRTSSSYLSNISRWSSGSASAGAADELHQGRPSVHKVSSRLVKQLASMSSTSSTAPCPPSNSFIESTRGSRSALSSRSGQSESNYSDASGSYMSNISAYSSGSASACAADFGANELHQGHPSILVEHLASMSSTTSCTAPCPPSNSYCESIRNVAWPERRIMWNLSSLSGQNGSNYSSYSGASSSYMSKNSGYSSGTAGDFGASELMKIAHRMVSDGYTQHMVEAFKYGGKPSSALETWFIELDVDWVLQCCEGHTLQQQFQVQDKSASRLQELVHRWIQALTIIVVGIKELVAGAHDTPAAARFGNASISAMLALVAPILDVLRVENLQDLLDMYICVSSYNLRAMYVVSSEAQSILNEIGALLKREENRLNLAISTRMWNIRTLIDRDDLWASEISQGGGEVNKKFRCW